MKKILSRFCSNEKNFWKKFSQKGLKSFFVCVCVGASLGVFSNQASAQVLDEPDEMAVLPHITQQKLYSDSWFFTISAGAVIPLGDFKSTTPDPREGTRENNGPLQKDVMNAGFAKTGFNLEFAANYSVTNHFGFLAKISYMQNQIDEVAFEKELRKNMGQYIPNIEDRNVYFESDGWLWVSAMVGVRYTQPFGNDIFFDANTAIGPAFHFLPEYFYSYGNSGTGNLYQNTLIDNNDVGVAFSIGGALRFPLFGDITARAYCDYYLSNPELKSDIATQERGVQTVVEEVRGKMNVSTLNVGFGIVYNF